MDEEEAFWSFVCMVEELLPEGYYSRHLHGVHVECRVLEALLHWKCPEVSMLMMMTSSIVRGASRTSQHQHHTDLAGMVHDDVHQRAAYGGVYHIVL